jgi:hypothetical protein
MALLTLMWFEQSIASFCRQAAGSVFCTNLTLLLQDLLIELPIRGIAKLIHSDPARPDGTATHPETGSPVALQIVPIRS